MPLRRLLLACAILAATAAPSAAAKPAAATVAPDPASDFAYFLGTWDVAISTPGEDKIEAAVYEVRRFTDTAWLTGRGTSSALKLDARDVWGRDPITGEVMRMIFDASGTQGVVKSPGWRNGVLVLEGEARSRDGVVRVRETIRRVSDAEFVATWEAYRDGAWSAYSIERVTRRSA